MLSAFIAALLFFSFSDGAIIYSSGDYDLALTVDITSIAYFIF